MCFWESLHLVVLVLTTKLLAKKRNLSYEIMIVMNLLISLV